MDRWGDVNTTRFLAPTPAARESLLPREAIYFKWLSYEGDTGNKIILYAMIANVKRTCTTV